MIHRANSLDNDWVPAPRAADYDYQSLDGRHVVEVRKTARGIRDLHSALLQLAVVVVEHPRVERAFLLIRFPSMTTARVEREWRRVQRVLSPSVRKKIAIVGIAGGATFTLPDDTETRHLATRSQKALLRSDDAHPRRASTGSAKFFDVWKVLLASWLAHEGPLQIGELARRAGCSYPTVAKALDRLHDRREIERDSSRSAKLRAFPRHTLREVLALAHDLRRPRFFLDATGRQPDPWVILRRLQTIKPPGVALSGVLAARHYDPHFDLRGLPRLDVIAHDPLELEWVHRVDPALQRAPETEPSPVLVVRPLTRPVPAFVTVNEYKLPIADPVETLLDLYELRLDQQADDLVRVLRNPGGTT